MIKRALCFCLLLSCEPGTDGEVGPQGPAGPPGPPGTATTTTTAGSRLKPRFLIGADGSRVLQDLWDTKRNEACRFAMAADNHLYCFPIDSIMTRATYFYYADPTCTTLPLFPTLNAAPFDRSMPRYGILFEPNIEAIYSLTPYNEGTTYYRSGAECKAEPIAVGSRWYKGQRLRFDEFVEGQVEK